MNMLDTFAHRRSVRVYTGEPVPEEKLHRILQAGLLSASSRARRPWEMYVITSSDKLAMLSECRVGSAKMLERAGAAIVVFGKPEASDVWVEDCSIVMANMHLMADALGLGSCWIQGRLRPAPDGTTTDAFVKKLLGVPEEYALEAILSIGVADEEKRPEPYDTEKLAWEKIHRV